MELDSVPFHSQEAYACGPAALAMALGWSGIASTPQELEPAVYTPSRQGSLQSALIAGVRRNGRVAYEIDGVEELLGELSGGHPVIVMQNLGLAWYPVWHYAVVIGYDLQEGIILLHSGTQAHKRTSLPVFKRTWARGGSWGLLVLPPEKLPASAGESDVVRALAGLERSGNEQVALLGYDTALQRWPRSLVLQMGRGNSLHKLGDLRGAEGAFRTATRYHPNSGAAFNNLAQVLVEQGQHTAALEAAQTAVSLGGPHRAAFVATLQEISGLAP